MNKADKRTIKMIDEAIEKAKSAAWMCSRCHDTRPGTERPSKYHVCHPNGMLVFRKICGACRDQVGE